MAEKYAVYAVVVEDTEEADMEVSGVEVERIAGNLTIEEAESLTKAMVPLGNFEKAE